MDFFICQWGVCWDSGFWSLDLLVDVVVWATAPSLRLFLTPQFPNGAEVYPTNTLIHIHAGAALMCLPTHARRSCGRSLKTASSGSAAAARTSGLRNSETWGRVNGIIYTNLVFYEMSHTEYVCCGSQLIYWNCSCRFLVQNIPEMDKLEIFEPLYSTIYRPTPRKMGLGCFWHLYTVPSKLCTFAIAHCSWCAIRRAFPYIN